MERDRGADVDNEQVDSVLGDHVDRQVVVGTLPLPAVTIIPINISNAKLMDAILHCVLLLSSRGGEHLVGA